MGLKWKLDSVSKSCILYDVAEGDRKNKKNTPLFNPWQHKEEKN